MRGENKIAYEGVASFLSASPPLGLAVVACLVRLYQLCAIVPHPTLCSPHLLKSHRWQAPASAVLYLGKCRNCHELLRSWGVVPCQWFKTCLPAFCITTQFRRDKNKPQTFSSMFCFALMVNANNFQLEGAGGQDVNGTSSLCFSSSTWEFKSTDPLQALLKACQLNLPSLPKWLGRILALKWCT